MRAVNAIISCLPADSARRENWSIAALESDCTVKIGLARDRISRETWTSNRHKDRSEVARSLHRSVLLSECQFISANQGSDALILNVVIFRLWRLRHFASHGCNSSPPRSEVLKATLIYPPTVIAYSDWLATVRTMAKSVESKSQCDGNRFMENSYRLGIAVCSLLCLRLTHRGCVAWCVWWE
jgi:hypothetical protein